MDNLLIIVPIYGVTEISTPVYELWLTIDFGSFSLIILFRLHLKVRVYALFIHHMYHIAIWIKVDVIAVLEHDKHVIVSDEKHILDIRNLRIRNEVQLSASGWRFQNEAKLFMLALAYSDHAWVHWDDMGTLNLPFTINRFWTMYVHIVLAFLASSETLREFKRNILWAQVASCIVGIIIVGVIWHADPFN